MKSEKTSIENLKFSISIDVTHNTNCVFANKSNRRLILADVQEKDNSEYFYIFYTWTSRNMTSHVRKSTKQTVRRRNQLTWDIATRSSVSIGSNPSCLTAKWNEPTEMHAICFGLTFILVKKRSTRLVALKRTSFGKSYQTLRQRRTWAAPSRVPIVISPSCIIETTTK